MLHIQQTPGSGEGSAAKKGRGLVGRVVAAAVSVVMLGSMSFAPGLALADSAQATTQNNTTVVAGDTAAADAAAAQNGAQATTDSNTQTKLGKKAQAAQDAINALPDASAQDFAVTSDNVGTLNQQLDDVTTKVNAVPTAQAQQLDTTRADVLIQKVDKYSHDWAVYAAKMVAENDPSPTKLPVKRDGTSVTWGEVRDYIDKNFTGSTVFANAVYDTIYASGQDYTNKDNYGGATLRTAADVVKYFGAPNASGRIVVTDRLEDNAVLTGILLLTRTATLVIEDSGSHDSLDFIEDAYSKESESLPTGKDMGPAVEVKSIGISVLPKNPYQLNLTRTIGNNLHNFQTTAYNRLPINILRQYDGNDTHIDIDTTLKGRAASVDFGKLRPSAQRATGAVINPTAVTPRFISSSEDETTTDTISVNSNHVIFSIPANGEDGKYQELVVFGNLYNYYADASPQRNSVNYYYRADVTYLNKVEISGDSQVLSDLVFKKTNKAGAPISGVKFKIYSDSAGTKPAQEAVVENGKVKLDNKGSIVWRNTGTYTTNDQGKISVPYLAAGRSYYLKEISGPAEYEIDNTLKEIPVSADGVTVSKATATKGEGDSAEVVGEKNTAIANNFKDARNWDMAWNGGNGNVTFTSGKTTATVNNGVFVKNDGDYVALTDGSATGAERISDNTYTVKYSDGTVHSYKTLAEAQGAINSLIENKELTADNAVITVDTGKQVYYKAVDPNADPDQDHTIVNKKLPVYIQPKVKKVLTGTATTNKAKEFKFNLSGEGVDQTVSVNLEKNSVADATAESVFDALKFGEDNMKDASGNLVDQKTFTYTISEVPGDDKDITYDGQSYTMTVDVSTLAGSGYLAKVNITDASGKSVAAAQYTSIQTNKTSTDMDGNITYTPRPGQVDGVDFKFENILKPAFEFTKTNGDNHSQHLQGAEFQLYRCNAGAGKCSSTELVDWQNGSNVGADKAWSVFDTQTSGQDGKVKFSGLSDGEYRLVETKAPAVFTLPTGQWKITVKDGTVSSPEAIADKNGNEPAGFGTPTDGSGIELYNYPHMTVPSTGGRGLIVFATLGGALLLAGVTVVTIDSRRRAQLQ